MHPGAHDPAKPALIMAESGDVTTFGDLESAANRLSRLFRDHGLGVGDHVAMTIENTPVFLDVLWGAHYAGLLYTATSTALSAEELSYIVDNCDARIYVLSAKYADKGAAIKAATPTVEHYYSVGGHIDGYSSLEDAIEGLPDTPLDEEGRIGGRDMLYSSGTTGKPKGITPRGLEAPFDAPHLITPVLKGLLGASPDDVYLSPAPLYHAAPLRWVMSYQQMGCTVVMMERFDAEKMLELIPQHGVTSLQVVPTMFVRLLRLPEEVRAAADVSSLKAVTHAAAPCPPEVKQQMIDWLGPIIHEYYGSTEGCGVTWITSPQWLEHPGSVGKAVIGQPKILGDDGQEVAAGETGAVYFAEGPPFQYHKDPEKTASVVNEQGWAQFGDIGHLDEEGFLYLTDRASYTIISGGVNIYPQESEDVLLSHDGVMDAAVFGVPHPDFGEAVQAVVQPRELPGSPEEAAALEAELIAYCQSKLSKVKCPKQIHFRTELPRTDTGKLFKRILKDEYAKAAAEGREIAAV
jgi:long-chain acyl-CoA synthetase